MQDFQPIQQPDFSPLPRPTLPLAENKKFTPFYGRRVGLFYTWTSVSAQLIAVALFYLIAIFAASLPEETANVVLSYAGFVTQLIILGCVSVFFIKYKTNPVEAGLRKTEFLPCLIGVLFCVSLQFTTSPFEVLFDEFLGLFGYEISNVIENIPMDGGLLVLALFVIALLPAFAEEFVFRGIILEGTKKLGTLQACLLNGLLFSLFHCNPSQTCYTFLMGAGWALVAIRCNSIVPTVIAHFLNNAYAVLMMYFNITEFPDEVAMVIVIAAYACTVGGLIYFLEKNKSNNERRSVHAAPVFKGALGGLIFNGVLWLIVFIEGIIAV